MSEKQQTGIIEIPQSSPVSYKQNGEIAEVVVVQRSQVPITNNQIQKIDYSYIKTNPEMLTCPNCGYVGYTRVITNCNIGNLLCCLFTDPICWCCFQLCRGKDLSCNDANHFCFRCNTQLASYSAC